MSVVAVFRRDRPDTGGLHRKPGAGGLHENLPRFGIRADQDPAFTSADLDQALGAETPEPSGSLDLQHQMIGKTRGRNTLSVADSEVNREGLSGLDGSLGREDFDALGRSVLFPGSLDFRIRSVGLDVQRAIGQVDQRMGRRDLERRDLVIDLKLECGAVRHDME